MYKWSISRELSFVPEETSRIWKFMWGGYCEEVKYWKSPLNSKTERKTSSAGIHFHETTLDFFSSYFLVKQMILYSLWERWTFPMPAKNFTLLYFIEPYASFLNNP